MDLLNLLFMLLSYIPCRSATMLIVINKVDQTSIIHLCYYESAYRVCRRARMQARRTASQMSRYLRPRASRAHLARPSVPFDFQTVDGPVGRPR